MVENTGAASKRRQQILCFLKECEKLKSVERIPLLSQEYRRENDAEHSWHLAVMVLAFEKEIGLKFDVCKALKLAAVHDLPEAYVGDCWPANEREKKEKKEREEKGAQKIFGHLPSDLRDEFTALWREYDEGRTVEAKIVKALDKICYPLQYSLSGKIVYPPGSEDYGIEEKKRYAAPHCEFNPALLAVLDQLLEELYSKKREVIEPREYASSRPNGLKRC